MRFWLVLYILSILVLPAATTTSTTAQHAMGWCPACSDSCLVDPRLQARASTRSWWCHPAPPFLEPSMGIWCRRVWVILLCCCFLWKSYAVSVLGWTSHMNFLQACQLYTMVTIVIFNNLGFSQDWGTGSSKCRAFVRNSSSVKTQASVTWSSFKLWNAKLRSLRVLKLHLLLAQNIW